MIWLPELSQLPRMEFTRFTYMLTTPILTKPCGWNWRKIKIFWFQFLVTIVTPQLEIPSSFSWVKANTFQSEQDQTRSSHCLARLIRCMPLLPAISLVRWPNHTMIPTDFRTFYSHIEWFKRCICFYTSKILTSLFTYCALIIIII